MRTTLFLQRGSIFEHANEYICTQILAKTGLVDTGHVCVCPKRFVFKHFYRKIFPESRIKIDI